SWASSSARKWRRAYAPGPRASSPSGPACGPRAGGAPEPRSGGGRLAGGGLAPSSNGDAATSPSCRFEEEGGGERAPAVRAARELDVDAVAVAFDGTDLRVVLIQREIGSPRSHGQARLVGRIAQIVDLHSGAVLVAAAALIARRDRERLQARHAPGDVE